MFKTMSRVGITLILSLVIQAGVQAQYQYTTQPNGSLRLTSIDGAPVLYGETPLTVYVPITAYVPVQYQYIAVQPAPPVVTYYRTRTRTVTRTRGCCR